MIELTGHNGTATVFAAELDETTRGQVETLLDQPFVAGSRVRIMPDCHAGKGCVIGTTMTVTDKAVPNLVGVDIGCGMLAVRLAEEDVDLATLDEQVRRTVPVGPEVHRSPVAESHPEEIFAKVDVARARKSIGTLGGGNHFIELDRSDRDGALWLVIHTGSRQLGCQVCDHYQQAAWDALNGGPLRDQEQALIARLKAEGRHQEISGALKQLRADHAERTSDVPFELAWLEGDLFQDYLHDMKLAQEHARRNRAAIADRVLEATGLLETERFETVHNYIDLDAMVLRKGAVSAREGERLLIPMNMRDGALICRGKGNEDWNQSAPHGAGRLMSRAAARKRLSMEEFREEMDGVYSSCVVPETLDESPMAYKPMNAILEQLGETAEVVERLRPVYNFKATR